jgi:homoserine kinase
MSLHTSLSRTGACTIQVPATSANLGSGFDTLGVAVSLYNRFHFLVQSTGPSRSEAFGEGADSLNQCGGSCLVLQAAQQAAERIGQALPPLMVYIESHIPVQRGLGSSASAVVAGVVAADVLLSANLSADRLLWIAAEMEGHADNVAPALRGGFQAAIYENTTAVSARLPVPEPCWDSLRLVVCVPERRMSTGSARAALPDFVPHKDAAFNVGRASLLTAALCSGQMDLLRLALQDRLHQPYRRTLLPGFDTVIAAAEATGAYGACLSGSGSTMLALAPSERADEVGVAMQEAFLEAGTPSRWWNLTADKAGARVLPYSLPDSG